MLSELRRMCETVEQVRACLDHDKAQFEAGHSAHALTRISLIGLGGGAVLAFLSETANSV